MNFNVTHKDAEFHFQIFSVYDLLPGLHPSVSVCFRKREEINNQQVLKRKYEIVCVALTLDLVIN